MLPVRHLRVALLLLVVGALTYAGLVASDSLDLGTKIENERAKQVRAR